MKSIMYKKTKERVYFSHKNHADHREIKSHPHSKGVTFLKAQMYHVIPCSLIDSHLGLAHTRDKANVISFNLL